jgi:hypothetical protein
MGCESLRVSEMRGIGINYWSRRKHTENQRLNELSCCDWMITLSSACASPPSLLRHSARLDWRADHGHSTNNFDRYNQAPILILLTAQPCIFLA